MLFDRFLAAVLLLLCASLQLRLVHSQNPPGTLCPAIAGKPTCVCKHPDGELDLTSISNSDGTARWSELVADDYTYAFNPCNAFSGSAGCQDVHVCQTTSGGHEETIATKGTEKIYYNTAEANAERQLYLYYTGPSVIEQPREAFVYLVCDKGSTKVTALGEPETLRYEFEVRGKIACLGGGGSEAGFIGLILMVILLLAFVLYFVIGAVIMKVKYQATGADVVPNKHFWTELPILIKDGVLFTFSPCIGAIQQKRGKGEYSSI